MNTPSNFDFHTGGHANHIDALDADRLGRVLGKTDDGLASAGKRIRFNVVRFNLEVLKVFTFVPPRRSVLELLLQRIGYIFDVFLK